MHNGLSAAAATGGVLACAVPLLAMLPVTPAEGAVSAAVAARPADVALTLAAAEAEAGTAGVLVQTSFQPVEQIGWTPGPEVDAAGLLKAVGLADIARQAEETRLAREAQTRCDADLGGLGRVSPHVRDAAQFLSCLYEQPSLIGVAGRARNSDHPRGRALDLMVRGERGDRIAECALANQDELGISYVIWEQRYNDGSGWDPMEDRGSDTENHRDHVHISFDPSAGSGTPDLDHCS